VKQFLTTKEAAQFLNLKQNTLEMWRVKGIGPAFVKFNGACRYRLSDLEDYIKESTRMNTSQKGVKKKYE
jgi:predicted site-specific integrase-resolvase